LLFKNTRPFPYTDKFRGKYHSPYGKTSLKIIFQASGHCHKRAFPAMKKTEAKLPASSSLFSGNTGSPETRTPAQAGI
jgi:hypothetical protein